jgi:energy-converting hydrogenase B subunit D
MSIMLVLQATILIFVGITGTAVVLTRDPVRQVVGLSFYGLVLALLFFILQSPDVALSQITIGAVALPLMFMLSLAKVRRTAERRGKRGGAKEAA